MAQKRTGLGRGIGALIPSAPESGDRPVDVFFPAPAPAESGLVAVPGATLAQISPRPSAPTRNSRVANFDKTSWTS